MSAPHALMDSDITAAQAPVNITEFLLDAAKLSSLTGVRYIAGGEAGSEFQTYKQLLMEANCILGGLRAYNRRPGAKVALLLERARDFIPAFWGCVLGGLIPCPLTPIRNDPERWMKHLTHVDELLDHPLFVTSTQLWEELPDELPAVDLAVLRTAPAYEAFHSAQPHDTAALVLTSGSTGNSKAVTLTHSNLVASMQGKAQRQGLTAVDRTLNWISFDHVASLLEVHMVSLCVGAVQAHADPAPILTDPLLFLDLIHRYRVTVTFSPNFLLGQISALLERQEHGVERRKHAWDLSCIRYIVSGGEANVVDTGRRFVELLAPQGLARTAIRPAFGMTETCAGSIYSRDFPNGDQGEFASVGTPIAGLQMRVVEDGGAIAAPGEPGELQLRGTMIFSGYHNNPQATQAAFTADGWFRTGDLGRIEEGRLTLVGRSKDSIIVSGVNYFSQELEAALNELEGIERSFVAVFPTRPKGQDTEQLVVTFATSFPLEDEGRLHQLIVAVRSTTILLWGFRPSIILPLPSAAFPKTNLGKIQRTLLRKRLEAGELASHQAYVAEVTRRQLGGYFAPEGPAERAIAEIFAELFALDTATVSATASFFDLGGTSLDILKLIQMLAERLDRSGVSVATILQSPTVRLLAARLAPQMPGAGTVYDPLVPMQLSGTKPPLFCVHPGIGEVLVFVNLAKYFVNDRPFYAIRARGFEAGDPPFESLDEMVNTYVAAVRRRQPHGPYALAGYSLGGPIAVEMARVLESQGERVAFIGCLDGPPCDRVPALDAVDIAVSLAYFLSLIDRHQLGALPAQLRETQEDYCAYLTSVAPPDRLAELNLDLPRFRAWAALSHGLNTLGASYVHRAGGPTVRSLTVFHAEPLRFEKQEWLRMLRHWDRFAFEPIRYLEVGGDHASMLGPKHVGTFQAVLRAEIDRAFQ